LRVKIVRAAMRGFALPLVRPIVTAHGTLRARSGFLISVEDEAGRVAMGEATPFPEFGTEDLGQCALSLRRSLSAWLAASRKTADGFLALGAEGVGQAPCARAALEAAWFDLRAQARGVSLAAALRGEAGMEGAPLEHVSVQALVQGATPREVATSARAALEEGFDTFKLKLAVDAARRDVGLDLERVAALRDAVGESARLRLDANEAWTRAEAEAALARLAEFGIDYVEQPVARAALADLAALGRSGGVDVAADEALLGDGLAACLEARAASILVVKPAALGGVAASLSLVERARAEGLRVVWSNLFEGLVGRALALALAAATSDEGEVHGLGTAGLLAQDLGVVAGDSESKDERGGTLATASVLARARRVAPAWSRSDALFADGESWEARA
jgi:o-succinylbenzoate synthase